MRKLLVHWRWLLPLLLYSADAHAWGLYTHVYFAQLLLWAVPLSDPRCRRVIRSFPELVLAGACLPDLSLVGKHCGARSFEDTHLWANPRHLLEHARNDREYAIALGYASHLLVDVIAHNHFVPAHERMWLDLPVVTHAAAEWAMDGHIAAQLFQHPGPLLRRNDGVLAQYVAGHFGCSAEVAARALALLGKADDALRSSGVPQLCYRTARTLDRGLQRRFNYYLSETAHRLAHINRLLDGEEPIWHAEPPCAESLRQRIARVTHWQLRHRIPLPQDLFADH